ncbi:hypothetical protein Ade02nite_73200 [Paractinoplanes deccanensis]|uniref:CBM2 domain-containing protein n=1 Tax=Paractinoplanes deccanensis TaxID=113561 RepID=A0ABQ3YFD3_9ACTN|nr:cellulose binding domain-containing protein [Actinoplanes deccanensis]GID78679.1 hypothetical protein Ade02nite_73200 [Actinoplanes deccanensis]
MSAKHAVRLFGTARFVLSFGVAILVLLVVWIAVRAVGPAEAARQPPVTLPSMPQVPLVVSEPPATSAPAPAASRSASRSASASPSATSPSPTPSRTPSTTPPTSAPPTSAAPTSASPRPEATTQKPTSPAPRSEINAQLSVTASWDGGYVAFVRVENEGEAAANWHVSVTHSGLDDLELRGVWNASGNRNGSTLVFDGGSLAPGRSATFGYQISKSGRGDARPAGCSSVGGSCSVR